MLSRPRIIPVLSISDRDLVKTIKFSNPRYLGDPINAIKIFNGKGVDELCVLSICSSRKAQTPDFDYLKDIAGEAFMPLSYGGGITDMDQVRKLFRIGYEKVVINTAFYGNPALISEAAHYAGNQSVVVSIDVKTNAFGKPVCFSTDGTVNTKRSPVEAAMEAERLGAGELIINSINRDGTMNGYDIGLTKSVVSAVSIPVIACGGAGNTGDLKAVLTEGNAHAAAAASMFVYYGREKAVLINVPTEKELTECGVYREIKS